MSFLKSHVKVMVVAAAACALYVSTVSPAGSVEPAGTVAMEEAFQAAARRSFQLNRPSEFDRINDPTLAACNESGGSPSDKQVAAILQREQASIVYPANGQLMGDWKKGKDWSEQTHGGRIGVPGFADADDPRHLNGANCYACHAIDPAFPQAGNMAPPLSGYGSVRGISPEIVKYTYDKVFNAKATNPCSLMPRYGGPSRLLNEQQVADIVAFLLSPESPVNRTAPKP